MADQVATKSIDREKLFSLFTTASFSSGGSEQPNPDEPHKPGPWDPVIRVALRDMGHGPLRLPIGNWSATMPSPSLFELIARRFPQIWDVIGGGGRFDEVALNPQPLPPVETFIAALGEAVIARLEILGEVVRGTSGTNQTGERGIIIVSGFVNRLVDDWCGTGFRPHWPFPGPQPRWFPNKVTPRDTLVLAARFHQGSSEAWDPTVSRALADAANKLADAALSRTR